MVNLGNEWDEILKDEFVSEYYQKLREFLKYEYSHYRIFPDMNDIFNSLKYASYSTLAKLEGKVNLENIKEQLNDKKSINPFFSFFKLLCHRRYVF